MTPAGRRDQIVTIERNHPIENDHGDEVAGWTPIGTVFAMVTYGRGDERRQAAREESMQTATFRLLSTRRTRGLTTRDRLVLHGTAWDIVGLSPLPGRGEIEFDARRAG